MAITRNLKEISERVRRVLDALTLPGSIEERTPRQARLAEMERASVGAGRGEMRELFAEKQRGFSSPTLLLVALFAIAASASAQTSLIDVSTGSRCTAVFVPAAAATDVQIDCQSQGKPVLAGAKVNLAAIVGSTSGVVIGYTVGTESITLLFKRATSTAPLHVEASVNGAMTVNKDVAVP